MQGRLSHSGLGTMRGEIRLHIPSDYDWGGFGASGAIGHLTRTVTRIMEIAIPREPKTKMVLGSLRSGSTFNAVPLRGLLRFEITSEADAVVTSLEEIVRGLVEEFSTETGVNAKLERVLTSSATSLRFRQTSAAMPFWSTALRPILMRLVE